MTPFAIFLIVTSAILHAGWNLVSKRQNPSLAFFFVTAVSGAAIVSPLLIRYRQSLAFIPGTLWWVIIATGVAQAIYFSGLAGAYRRGDMSVAYPLARALPVLFVALVTILLGKRAELTNLGLVGMGLIAVGCIILPMRHFDRWRLTQYANVVCLMALVAAIGTTGYTLIDDFILRELRGVMDGRLSTSDVTLMFVALQTGSTALMIGLATLLCKERQQLATMLHNRPLLFKGLLTGIIIMAAYGLVLASMAYVTNVSYVAAFRQLSIPLGAILGLTLQNEPRYTPKLIGIMVVFVGLLLVGVF